MRLPKIAIAYEYSLSLLMKSWCQLVEFNAQSQGYNQSEVETILFGKTYDGRQWRRWRDDGQLTESKEFILVADAAFKKRWIDKDLNSLFCESYKRRYSVRPTEDSECDHDIIEICKYFTEYSEKSSKLKATYENLHWYGFGPHPDDPTLTEWEEIHIRVGEFINKTSIFEEIENKLLEISELIDADKIFNDLTPNVEKILKKLRRKGRIK